MENSSSQKESDNFIYEELITDPQEESERRTKFSLELPITPKEAPRKPRLLIFFGILCCILAAADLAVCIFIAGNVSGPFLTRNDDNYYPSSEFSITIYSDGCCSYNQTRDLQSLFFVNNIPVCPDWGNGRVERRHHDWSNRRVERHHRGFNFAIFDLPFGGIPRLEDCSIIDYHDCFDKRQKQILSEFLEAIPGGRLVLISVWDTGVHSADRLDNATKRLLQSLNPSSKTINEISLRDSYAFIGYKTQGPCHPPWVTDLRGSYDAELEDAHHIVLRGNISSTWECATK